MTNIQVILHVAYTFVVRHGNGLCGVIKLVPGIIESIFESTSLLLSLVLERGSRFFA
jgi:hypothetical protein